ncbi:hypothetical protein ACFLIM_34645 [Nonomuraea sp. M3C6]|uniref:GNAT acetyltransferase n=1 Tax=Nonomuraea marmarensis TaxID=3351344 RepID=A0ABW7ALY0_9ACTN
MTIREAARNNAEWCDLVCRTHQAPGTFTGRAWTNPTRTPLLYPDAVTLSPEATAADVLDHIDQGSGASVKDSFAALDLPGFDVLFEAEWIYHPTPGGTPGAAATGDPIAWEVVDDAATLRDWEQACFAGGVTDLFLPGLLAEAKLLCGRIEGDIVCGSALNASGRVVGVSNVYASGCDIDAAWSGTLALAADLFPGRPLVGYETDPEDAMKHGFTTIGPLRVWLKP